MDKGLPDNSTGDVVIRDGSVETQGPRDGGFFTIGGGGGFSGGFGGSSRRRAKKRARARAEAIAKRRAEQQAAADAAHQQQLAAQAAAQAEAHRQWVAHFSQTQQATQATIDRHYTAQRENVGQALKTELEAVRKYPAYDGSERWQLHLITRERQVIEEIIAAKAAELQRKTQMALAFDGQDPLQRTAQDYAQRLAQQGSSQAFQQLHQDWEAAYIAAQEAQLLSEAIRQLTERSNALAASHAEQKVVWKAREEEWERQRQYKELREERVRFKQLADENLRLKRIREANSLTMPMAASAGGVVLAWGGSEVVQEVGKDIERLVRAAVQELSAAGLLATKVFKHPALVAAFHIPETGNSELTTEQRQRLQGIGISSDLMGVRPGQDLQALADAGQMAELDYRVKLETHQGTTAIIVASTGEDIPSRVPVRSAVFDPLTNTFRAEGAAATDRDLVFSADPAPGDLPRLEPHPSSGLLSGEPEVFAAPDGADFRIKDCIVCIPGMVPVYFSFDVPPVGTGVVSGTGQAATVSWWQASTQPGGAGIPAKAAATLRGKAFASFAGFERALWQAISQEAAPGWDFSEPNQRRIADGLAPYAPKSSWVGQRRELEVRYLQGALGTAPYDLDQISLQTPASAVGVRPETRPFAPWLQLGEPISLEAAKSLAHSSGGRRTWTPLVPPGSDLLGSTDLPQGPTLPGTIPGAELDPYRPQIETLPGLDGGQTGSTIPGYGGGVELPTSGLVFSDPLDVGPYSDLGRDSVKDGLDIDHIVSKKALELFIRRNFPEMTSGEIDDAVRKAPSMAIPSEIHRKFSETYGGRNSRDKQIQDSIDLKAGVNSNVDALKSGLLEYGLKESDIEQARQKLHELYKSQGWTE
ncbi:S-type pyocin domain-containing protein [Pseudomonas sp. 148P]|uniref:S-type pyocin domain-containing protein n=1 Tax=Pseudomonas ulcerans TaxID=3115852 RepID=A0ABU7HK02_9PSED|nr:MULTISPECIES: S-type pyocin domain-containing protein [unclassified Pseudomonas]MEE1922218.1 S-type pyocin domain-containing protein [Pseudomonas sp. 147P]MEE1931863.1 S-type pyocin domain-containing protein [Pseudomonas sp. 148P]